MQKGLVFEDVVAVVGDNGSSFITVILVHLRSSSLFLRFTCVVWLCGGVTESTTSILRQPNRTLLFSDARKKDRLSVVNVWVKQAKRENDNNNDDDDDDVGVVHSLHVAVEREMSEDVRCLVRLFIRDPRCRCAG